MSAWGWLFPVAWLVALLVVSERPDCAFSRFFRHTFAGIRDVCARWLRIG
ncbi:MAG TPA: hypothetical protein VIL68_05835 [Propionibacteriaceae bacterium]